MHIRCIAIIAALTAALVSGCSKPARAVTAPKIMKDLGAFELAAGTQTNFSLGTNKSCTLVGKQVPNGVQLDWVFLMTNADGTVERSLEHDETAQAQPSIYRVWDMTFFVKVTVK